MYRVSTNPAVATGDGIALAYRAGAEVMDMEFVQFHPTALKLPGVQPFLISEAVRGEGGVLRDTRGERFMPDYHSKAELAPRDVVARAIVERMEATGADHVLLDVTHLERGARDRALSADLSLLPRRRTRYHARADPRVAGGALYDGRHPDERLG